MHRTYKSASESSLLNLGKDYSNTIRKYLREHNPDMIRHIIHNYGDRIQWDFDLVVELLAKKHIWPTLVIQKICSHIDINALEKIILLCANDPLLESVIRKELVERLQSECLLNDSPVLFLKILRYDPFALDCPTFKKMILDKKLNNLSVFYDENDGYIHFDNDVYEMITMLPQNVLCYYFQKNQKLFQRMRDPYKNNLLHYSVIDNNYSMVESLITIQFDINQKNIWSLTPLNEAVRLGYHQIANLLREHGAFLHTRMDSKQSIIGMRTEFFNKLKFIISLIPYIFPERDIIFQLFHSVADNHHLYHCSIAHHSPVLTDFFEISTHFVFDKENKILFQVGINIIADCDSIPQERFFMAPMCSDSDIKTLVTFPFMIGKTFLGYFFIWSKDLIYRDDVEKCMDFIIYCMASDYTPAIVIYPHLLHEILSVEKCHQYYCENRKRAESHRSIDFYKAIHNLVPLIRFTHFTIYDGDVLRTLYDCHIPCTKISTECLKKLESVLRFVPQQPIRPSHLFRQMMALHCDRGDETIRLDRLHYDLPKHFSSFDLYEIIGSHHENYKIYRSCLPTINRFLDEVTQTRQTPRYLFDKCVCLISQVERPVYRDAPVLGLEDSQHYIIFLPHYEINQGLSHIFDAIEQDIPPSLSHIRLMCIKLLEWVHPLQDGNGRTVRLFISIFLRSHGIPIIYAYNKTNSIDLFLDNIKKFLCNANAIKNDT